MYPRLELEMKRKGITKKQVADCISVSYDTVIKKFSGKNDWWREEMEKIIHTFFPTFKIDDLFKKEEI